MKVNIWERDKDARNEDDNNIDSIDYIYQHYRPAKSTTGLRRTGKDNRWVFQLLASGLILAVVFGLFRFNVPFSEALRSGMRYLMTVETDVQPAFHKIVQLAAQTANVEWPLVDDVPQPASTALTEVPGEAVLLLPVSGNVIRSYGWMIDLEEKVEGFHEGIDIAVPVGTKVKASADGKVIKAGEKDGLGRFVLVKNDTGEVVRYANLKEILVQLGQEIKAGEEIAASGLESDKEPHVHFEVIVSGRPVDPLTRMGVDFTRISVPPKN